MFWPVVGLPKQTRPRFALKIVRSKNVSSLKENKVTKKDFFQFTFSLVKKFVITKSFELFQNEMKGFVKGHFVVTR